MSLLAGSSLIFWLGITSPLVLVCAIFVAVGLAGKKEEELSAPGSDEEESVDSQARRSL